MRHYQEDKQPLEALQHCAAELHTFAQELTASTVCWEDVEVVISLCIQEIKKIMPEQGQNKVKWNCKNLYGRESRVYCNDTFFNQRNKRAKDQSFPRRRESILHRFPPSRE